MPRKGQKISKNPRYLGIDNRGNNQYLATECGHIATNPNSKWCRKCFCAKGRSMKCKKGHDYNEHNRCLICTFETRLRIRYNITPEIYAKMLEIQENKCGICGVLSEYSAYGKLVIDHNHSCCNYEGSCGKCIRGLLCSRCNAGLSIFGDNPSKLMSAMKYLV